MRQHPLVNGTTSWDAASMNPSDAYKESISYDANGNIQTFVRNGKEGNVLMDNLVYMYEADPVTGKKLSNKLRQVKDSVAAAAYTEDLDNQESEDNYQYDAIGNLTKDIKEGITGIDWTVYGKISSIAKAGSTINYTYDASGNRVSKTVTSTNGTGVITFYVRDAQGNSLGIYERDTSNQILWKEQTLYGSSRLGMFRPDADVSAGTSDADIASKLWANYVGYQNYELGNHLGNVLAVITDKRTLNSSGVYEADIVGASDYYVFGQSQPGRTFGSLGRYGFNGKENDNEVKGAGNSVDFGARIYDPRIGRWLSTDPLQEKYPALTPYNFAGNSPISHYDPDGKIILIHYKDENGNSKYYRYRPGIKPATNNTFVNQVHEAVTYAMKNDGAKTFQQLDKSKREVLIERYEGTDNAFAKADKGIGQLDNVTIEWNPLIGVKTDDGGGNPHTTSGCNLLPLVVEFQFFQVYLGPSFRCNPGYLWILMVTNVLCTAV